MPLTGQGEIQDGKLLMVFFGRLVVCFCGFDFVVEISDEFEFAVNAYLDVPYLSAFVPAYSSVFR